MHPNALRCVTAPVPRRTRRPGVLFGLLLLLLSAGGLDHAGVVEPRLFVDPASGPAGTIPQVVGEGFFGSPCGANLYWDSTEGVLLAFTPVEAGSFSTSVTIPADATPGEHKIVAQGLLEGGEFCDGPSGDVAEAPFTVTGEPGGGELDFAIYLQNRVLGPDCIVDPDFVDEILGSGRPQTHGIVQLHRLPGMSGTGQQDDLAVLSEIGITLLDYLNGVTGPATAYLASFSSDLATEDPRFDELVRCLLPLEAGDKVDRDLPGNRGADQPVLVQFFGDVSEEDARTLFADLGIPAQPFAPPALWQAMPMADQLGALAAMDAVKWLEPKLVDDLLDLDEVRDVHGVDGLQDLDTTSGVYGGLSGDGVQIGIMDSGVDDDHNDFAGRIIRFLDNGGDHGSHVAGIAAGSGFQSDKNDDAMVPNGGTPFQWRGMAPESQIAAYGTSGASAGGDAGTMNDAINNFGVDVSNHSYSSAPSGRYNALMASIDTIIRGSSPGIPARPQTWSAGNGGLSSQYGQNLGYFALTKTCKNCTIIANVTKSQIHAGGSSMGPTADGRLKPDLSTVGSSVTSVGADADRDGNPAVGNGYRSKSGTSMASPAAAGIIALMLEQYAQTFGVNLDISPPLPSTSRAILIHTAVDLAGTDPSINPDTGAAVNYGAGPDWATGYGLADAPGAVKIIEDQGFIEDSLDLADVTDDYLVDVVSGQTVLRVTLAWDDLPGTPNANDAAAKLVNDLDLVLVEPDGTTIHRPLVLPLITPRDCDPGTPGIQTGSCAGLDSPTQNYFGPAAEGVDRRNNAEQVVVEDLGGLATGNWTARVSVLNDDGMTVRLPLGGSQPYSLVLQQPNVGPVAMCQGEITVQADDACCVTVTVDDIDDGSFDPNGNDDIDDLCIASVDGDDVGCQASVEICGTGAHTATLAITDTDGASDSCETTVVVEDVTPPVIECPEDQVLECPADTTPGNTGEATATDNCSETAIGFEDVSEPGCGGTETITRTWTATDDSGNFSDCEQVIEVVDTTPPDVVCGVGEPDLWPPNHKFEDVGFGFETMDSCDPAPPVIDIAVSSDENPLSEPGSGGPVHCPDAIIEDDGTVLLRAERAGTGDGRFYVITVSATDECGNVGVCSTPVTVNHSNGNGGEAVDSGQAFDATVCNGSGARTLVGRFRESARGDGISIPDLQPTAAPTSPASDPPVAQDPPDTQSPDDPASPRPEGSERRIKRRR